MRKLAATALTAMTICLLGSTAALADHAPNHGPGYNQQQKGEWDKGEWDKGPRGGDRSKGRQDDRAGGRRDGRDDDRFDRFDRDDDRFDRGHDRRFDFQLHFGNLDRWERGWGRGHWQNQYRYHQPLSHWQLVRRLERQGFYVRHLQRSRWGFGYRALAFNYRGHPVMLRVNPYTGRVMNVRYI